MFESLLTNENLNTVVAATMHNIQPRAGDNIKDFTAINMWYKKGTTSPLDQTSSPLMTTEGLNQLADLDPTFMKDPKKGHQEGNISQALGRQHFSFLLKKMFQGRIHHLWASFFIALALCTDPALRL